MSQIFWIKPRKRLIDPLLYFSKEFFEVVGSEGRSQSGHFIDNTSQWPDVALRVIRSVIPHFRTCVVRSSSLCPGHPPFGNLWNIEVAQFVESIRCAENVSAFQISVEDVDVVKHLETSGHLNHCLPYFRLVETSSVLEVIINLLLEVPSIGYLHHNAEGLRPIVKKGLSVVDDVGMRNRG